MKICFVQCPAFGVDSPPLGISYLATFISKKKFTVKVFDFNIDLYNHVDKKYKYLWLPSNIRDWTNPDKFDQFEFITKDLLKNYSKKIISYNPSVISFSTHSTSVQFTIKLTKIVKRLKPSIKIIYGGPQCFIKEITPKDIISDYGFHQYPDFMIIGEGEETLLELLTRIKNGSKTDDVAGCISSKNIKNPRYRKSIEDLDSLPLPDFSFFDLEKYPDYKHGKLRILSSRGCVSKCVFCTDTMSWKKYRTRSAENIFKEFKLRKKQGINTLEFNDSLLNGDLKNLSKLCDLLIKNDIGMYWGGSVRVNERMNYSFLKRMKQANCSYLSYGVESASNKVLKKMNKNILSFSAMKIIVLTRLAGIKVFTNWIIGFPGETTLDFIKTLLFVTLLRPFINDVSVSTLFINPHSLMEKSPERFGIQYDKQRNWQSIDGKNNASVRLRRAKIFLLVTKLLFYPTSYRTINENKK